VRCRASELPLVLHWIGSGSGSVHELRADQEMSLMAWGARATAAIRSPRAAIRSAPSCMVSVPGSRSARGAAGYFAGSASFSRAAASECARHGLRL